MRKWRKAITAVGLTAALTATGVGTAFASGTTTVGGDGANWTVPTTPLTNTVWKDADGNLVAANTEGATQYKVLTTWAEAWSTSGPDYLGISNSAYFGNGGNGNPTVRTYDAAVKNSTVGVWATSANESANAYNWNTFYNLYAANAGLDSSQYSDWESVSTTTNGGSDWDSNSGVWCGFKYRPDVVWLNNNLNASAAATYISQINNGQYSAAATKGTDKVYAPEAKEDGTYDSTFAQYGDATYSPELIQPNNNSPYSFVGSAYTLAEAAEKVIAATADNPGVGDEAVTWKNANMLPRSNRYSETPTECALNIEELSKGSVYYTLSQISANPDLKKKVAYVAYPYNYSSTDRRTGTTTTYTNEDQVIVAVYDYTENIGSGPMDGRASWTPLVVDQLQTNDVYAQKQGGGAVASTENSTTTYTLYYATADDLAGCDVVYSPQNSLTATQWQEWIEKHATSETAKEMAADITYACSSPCITNGSNFTMEKLIYGAYGMDVIYPELFPNMQLSTFWCDEIYHLTDESLPSAMSWIYATAALPAGTELSNLGFSYDRDSVYKKFTEGYNYYKSNSGTDATISRVLSNTALDGTTELSGNPYSFNGFAPSTTWTKAELDRVPDAEGVEGFVDRLYKNVLGRIADDAGKAVQVEGMKASGAAQVTYNFYNSAEFKAMAAGMSNAEIVENVYQTMLNRSADEAGKAMWEGYLDNGMSACALAAGFAESSEFAGVCAGYGIGAGSADWLRANLLEPRDKNPGVTAFASRMYTVVLGRAAEVDGLNVQCEALIGGTPCYQIAVNFFDSAEYANFNKTDSAFVADCYKAMMDREGSEAEVAAWVARMADEGLTRVDVVKGFCQSDEFEAICQSCGMTSGMR